MVNLGKFQFLYWSRIEFWITGVNLKTVMKVEFVT